MDGLAGYSQGVCLTRREVGLSARDGVRVIQRMYEAFNRHDLDRVVAGVTDDFELFDVAQGETYSGPDGFRVWLETWLRAMPDVQAEVVNLLVEGDWVVAEHQGRGTQTGPLPGPNGEIPPTGRVLELQMALFFLLRGTKVARVRTYYNQVTQLRQLGVL
jgi:steroid delta-isomerase-like uncharacterized protein